jgi:hypothetical protein
MKQSIVKKSGKAAQRAEASSSQDVSESIWTRKILPERGYS